MTAERDFELALNLATGANFRLSPPIIYGGVDNYPISVSALVAAKFMSRSVCASKDGEDRNYAYHNISDMIIQVEGEWLRPGQTFHDAPHETLW